MRKSGAWLAVHAMEQMGVRFTFGIPGVHNTELYDQLAGSDLITPILVTHECCAAFMADAISRTTDSLGAMVIVPAAGVTHALSGIGEAFLAGVPILIVSGGIRRDTGRHYQLHEVDQERIVGGLVKGYFRPETHAEIVPTFFRAGTLALSGEPGPVFVELSTELQLFSSEVEAVPSFVLNPTRPAVDPELIRQAGQRLGRAKRPGIYLGWGARHATACSVEIAELLGAPVATTLQGLSVFPSSHSLRVGMGFGPSAVPAARRAFSGCDCLLAVGVRFAELATGSYGLPVPPDLIHVDINPNVFNKNYPAALAIPGDAERVLPLLLQCLRDVGSNEPARGSSLQKQIKRDREEFTEQWLTAYSEGIVNPARFFAELDKQLGLDAFVTMDDGHHTFLAVEHHAVERSGHLISPSDFNAMGYGIPAAIATKLAHRDVPVAAIVGDGAFLMTGLELATASVLRLGVMAFVFADGELGQIAQMQSVPLGRKTCTTLAPVDFSSVARGAGAAYLKMGGDHDVAPVLAEASAIAEEGRPVVIEVRTDYSRKTEFTKGVLRVNFGRFSWPQKVAFLARAIKRHV